MRAVVQRVREASVKIEGAPKAQIGPGLVVLLGVGRGDTPEDASYLAQKVSGLRIFEDAQGKMNLSLRDIGGEVLVVSQFTLYGNTAKGRRPSFGAAAEPELAERLYEEFISGMKEDNIKVSTGAFGQRMLVTIQNDGPVTLILESKKGL